MFPKYSQNNHGFQWSRLTIRLSCAVTICLLKSELKIIDGNGDRTSTDSKTAAHGYHCKYTIYVPKCFRNTVKTVQTMDSNS